MERVSIAYIRETRAGSCLECLYIFMELLHGGPGDKPAIKLSAIFIAKTDGKCSRFILDFETELHLHSFVIFDMCHMGQIQPRAPAHKRLNLPHMTHVKNYELMPGELIFKVWYKTVPFFIGFCNRNGTQFIAGL